MRIELRSSVVHKFYNIPYYNHVFNSLFYEKKILNCCLCHQYMEITDVCYLMTNICQVHMSYNSSFASPCVL
jgi:hypothetical protein